MRISLVRLFLPEKKPRGDEKEKKKCEGPTWEKDRTPLIPRPLGADVSRQFLDPLLLVTGSHAPRRVLRDSDGRHGCVETVMVDFGRG